MRKKAIIFAILIPVGIVLLSLFLLIGSFAISFTPRSYETNSLNNYGKFTGNYNNEYPKEFTMSFFPQTIETHFTNVNYTYRAQKGDTYAFEVFLEFHIEDAHEFAEHIASIGPNSQWHSFSYNSEYMEYVVDDKFELVDEPTEYSADSYEYLPIRYANIGRILYCSENQTVIYSAMGVYDGGLAKTTYFNLFFSRFQIDPLEYAYART